MRRGGCWRGSGASCTGAYRGGGMRCSGWPTRFCARTGGWRDLARLSLVPEFGRGHGALYDGLNAGRVEFARLRTAVAGLPLPEWPDGRIRLAVDVSAWLRPDAGTSRDRMFCHVRGRGRNAAQMIPGWPYSFVAALGPGASSWTLPLDAVRLGPGDDETGVTAAQLRAVVGRLIGAGHWRDGDPPVIVALDAGLPPGEAGAPAVGPAGGRWWSGCGRTGCSTGRRPGARPGPGARPPRHGTPVSCADPATWRGAQVTAQERSPRYGPADGGGLAAGPPAADPAELRRGRTTPGRCPLIEGTLIQLAVARRPGGRRALGPMWLWAVGPGRRAGRGDRAVAGLPAPFRPRAHVPAHQVPARAGTARCSATRPPPTGGPGSSSPAAPSCGSPARSRPTSGCPGSGPSGPRR